MELFGFKPLTCFSQIIDGQTVHFKKVADGNLLYSDCEIPKEHDWKIANHEMTSAYNSVIENQESLVTFLTGISTKLSPYIMANKQFNCPYLFDRDLLFYRDVNSNGIFDYGETAIEIGDRDRNTKFDHISIFNESGEIYISLEGNDFSDLIKAVVTRGLRQCMDPFIEKSFP